MARTAKDKEEERKQKKKQQGQGEEDDDGDDSSDEDYMPPAGMCMYACVCRSALALPLRLPFVVFLALLIAAVLALVLLQAGEHLTTSPPFLLPSPLPPSLPG